MASAADTASPLVIQELSGEKRGLTLIGRALPYRPIAFSGKMRAEFTRYPGNPVATVQVLGPEEGQTTMQGAWKDKFLGTVDDQGRLVEATAIASKGSGGGIRDGLNLDLSSERVTSVVDLVNLVEDIRRSGQLLEINWDSIKREGMLMEFEHTWQNRHDVEWKMTFEWSSLADPDPPTAVPQTDTSDFQAELTSLGQTLSSLQSQVALAEDFTADMNSKITQLETAITSVAETVSQAVDVVLDPVDAARRLLGIVEYTKASAQDVMESAQVRTYRSVVTPMPLVLPDTTPTAATVTPGQTCAAAKYLRDTRAEARTIRGLSAQRGQEIAARSGEGQGATIVRAKMGQDLRDISVQLYGTADQWRLLKSYNRLDSSALVAGQIVLIPPAQRSAQA
jgi:hypothetical protein